MGGFNDVNDVDTTPRRRDKSTCASCNATAAACRSNDWLRGRRCCDTCTGNHDGIRSRGGCTDCDAHQTLNRQPSDQWGRAYILTIEHDDSCPTLNGGGES